MSSCYVSNPTVRTYTLAWWQCIVGSALRNNPQLSFILRGVQRFLAKHSVTHSRRPITPATLTRLWHQIHQSARQSKHVKFMVWATFMLAFHKYLRVGVFIAPSKDSFDPQRHLTWKDLSISQTHISVFLKFSKTDQ